MDSDTEKRGGIWSCGRRVIYGDRQNKRARLIARTRSIYVFEVLEGARLARAATATARVWEKQTKTTEDSDGYSGVGGVGRPSEDSRRVASEKRVSARPRSKRLARGATRTRDGHYATFSKSPARHFNPAVRAVVRGRGMP